MEIKNTTLLAITSYNQLEYTRRCFETIRNYQSGPILCLDDCSEEPIAELCKEYGVRLLQTTSACGLTYQWNQAYRVFKQEGHHSLIISGIDVLFPAGSLSQLIASLHQYPYVGALTRSGEPWKYAKAQAVEKFYDIDPSMVNDPQMYQAVQERIQESPLGPCKLSLVYGFCFGVNRDIISFEFDENHLFDPANVNIRQERDLGARVKEKMLCRTAFVYHYKGKSFGVKPRYARERRENIGLYRSGSKRRRMVLNATDYCRYLIRRLKRFLFSQEK